MTFLQATTCIIAIFVCHRTKVVSSTFFTGISCNVLFKLSSYRRAASLQAIAAHIDRQFMENWPDTLLEV